MALLPSSIPREPILGPASNQGSNSHPPPQVFRVHRVGGGKVEGGGGNGVQVHSETPMVRSAMALRAACTMYHPRY
eukprot:3846870-Rhodomonas_salina.1